MMNSPGNLKTMMRMKKFFMILAAAALVMAASCNKMDLAGEQDGNGGRVIVDITVGDLEPATKAIKQDWEDGDKIVIWFNGVASPNYCFWRQLPHLVLTRTAGAWTSSEVDEALLSASGTFNAVYESSNAMFADVVNSYYAYFPDGSAFRFTGYSNDMKTVRVPLVCLQNDVAYTYDGETRKISGTISDWEFQTRLQVVVNGLAFAADRYALTFAAGINLGTSLAYLSDNVNLSNVSECKGLTDNFTNDWAEGFVNGDGTAFYFEGARSSSATDYTIYLVDKTAKKLYSFTKNAEIPMCTTYYNHCKGIKVNFSSFTDITASHPLD